MEIDEKKVSEIVNQRVKEMCNEWEKKGMPPLPCLTPIYNSVREEVIEEMRNTKQS